MADAHEYDEDNVRFILLFCNMAKYVENKASVHVVRASKIEFSLQHTH